MYNFNEMDDDDYLKFTKPGKDFPYQLFESYIEQIYAKADKDEKSRSIYDSAHYSIACAQLYPNAKWLQPENIPDNLIQDLLAIGMVETSCGVLRFQKSSHAYFFICQVLIRDWKQLEVVENLAEEFFGPRGFFLRLFLKAYGAMNASFQSKLQDLLEKNLFYNLQLEHVNSSDLVILSPKQLNIDMEEYSATFGYHFPAFFIVQKNLSILRLLLTRSFQKVGEFSFSKTNEDHINNMGLLYAHFLNQAKLQNQLNAVEAREFLEILDKNSEFKINFDKFDTVLNEPKSLCTFLENCNQLQYVLLCQFIKFFFPNIPVDVGNMNDIRFAKVTALQVPTLANVEYIHETYPITDVDVSSALYLERCGLAIARGTMTLTPDMMYTFKHYLKTNGGWVEVYQNKILVELILPFIHMLITNYPCQVNKQELLEFLLDFSNINLTRSVEATALKSTLEFMECMIVENSDNVHYFIRFLEYLSKHDFCLLRKDKFLKIVNQNYDFVYNISTDANVISDLKFTAWM